MPNFNGAIVMHTLQFIKTPATLREIVATIAENTNLPEDELTQPIRQTLQMGHQMGFLQKLNGRYFALPMTFELLMAETAAVGPNAGLQNVDSKKKLDKKSKQMCSLKKGQVDSEAASQINNESTTTLMPADSKLLRKPKRSQLKIK
ncbi:uncharacterized protein LOC6570202 [Drosophila grimshawi]|uniref:GH25027 n=1 Tax=Drosophila grimshawi TaxID=7222 RepID=B4JZ73_DROGR|nr:uncharacterized protein LOC6570202 [Drosophila grimshawi]EDV94182.1 GH25027 [Drosophila grimshawi]